MTRGRMIEPLGHGAGMRRLTWGLSALAVVLMLSSALLSAGSGSVFIWAIGLVFAGVGVLIASRQPGNARLRTPR